MLDRAKAIEIVIPFLREREAFRAISYPDSGDTWTLGYGHTAGVHEGDRISLADAEKLLVQDATQIAEFIEDHLPDWLNPNQFAALISFAFNVGPGRNGVKDGFLILKNGKPSHLLRYLQAPGSHCAPITIADEFLHWVYVKGEVSEGVLRRRTLERKLFLTPFTSPGETPASGENDSPFAAGASKTKGASNA
jgi:lysozyme